MRFCRILFALCAIALVASDAQAGRFFGRHRGGCSGGSCASYSYRERGHYQQSYSCPTCPQAAPSQPYCVPGQPCPQAAPALSPKVGVSDAVDALDEVNQFRQRIGLSPWRRSEGLMAAARSCAIHRAKWCCEGHSPNDFAAVPPGEFSRASGCAARWPGEPFDSCCIRDGHYTEGGAAYAIGPDGRKYCQVYCR